LAVPRRNFAILGDSKLARHVEAAFDLKVCRLCLVADGGDVIENALEGSLAQREDAGVENGHLGVPTR
jgi:hypothetical protein